ncbi:DUF4115 domain-containing protein [Shimia sp. CNT1-13L.2]|uniref:helix-turn-helix domain-containing protein n=1 Tax=Shimia sp. CNT1-13L.2 TaxID=2959663 RepID=UPI0020CD3252|nr:helix-turn-helix domain-containing protein [Shimia sp. CNT1-13L.2]MCP9481911.1 DUF4115 domain-containing protein [Shimia sp. CNT1-13L.2]
MIRRKGQRTAVEHDEGPKGFDDYDLRLGDMMRGERATMGKSLLDVQRELRIRASYIAAIENADPTAFETPGFIAGYVRSYARYLGLDPDETFAAFCKESGFTPAHGMSAEASTMRKSESTLKVDRDALDAPIMAFTPAPESILSRIEPRAIGSSMVLVALIATIGYGGWSVLNEIQRVKLAPVEQTPVVLSELDPLNAAERSEVAGLGTPSTETLDRLYRPQALDVPVMVARDAPISTLNPDTMGVFTPEAPVLADLTEEVLDRAVPQVLENERDELVLMAVRPAWVRVRAADGSVLLEKILNAGEEFTLPEKEGVPTLTAGMSGSVYFKLNGALFGPVGTGTNRIGDLALDADLLLEQYDLADLDQDPELARIVAEADAALVNGQ